MTKEQESKNIRDLLRLMQENPGLPVLPMVYSEIVGEDNCSYWKGSFGAPEVRRYWDGAEQLHFYDEDDMDEVLYDSDFPADGETITEADEETLKAIYNSLPWVEAIVVFIEMPDG